MDDAKKDRLAELRKQRADSEAAADEAAAERELEAEELAITLSGAHGKRDEGFAIINNRIGGVFGIRKPDTRAIRNWEQASEKQKMSLEWQIGLLRHYIEPQDRAIKWAQMGAERPGLVWQTAERFVDLMSIDRESVAKK